MNVVCIGTGPSLTLEQIQTARDKGFHLYGTNKVFQIVPDLEVMYAVNLVFWDFYWSMESRKECLEKNGLPVPEGLEHESYASFHPCQKWTTNREAADKYDLNWIDEKWGEGLCADEGFIYHGHGSGYSLLGIAHKLGAERIVLLGYDMSYPPRYDGYQQISGGFRHYFGEYEAPMQHWPKRPWVDLLSLYREIHRQGFEIVCCTPGSALQGYIPSMDIANA